MHDERINLHEIILELQYNEELIKGYEQFDEGGTIGIPSDVRQAEKDVQYNVLKTLSGGDNDVVMKLIEIFGGMFRRAIKEYRKFGKVPNEKELIAFVNNHSESNIQSVVNFLKGQNP